MRWMMKFKITITLLLLKTNLLFAGYFQRLEISDEDIHNLCVSEERIVALHDAKSDVPINEEEHRIPYRNITLKETRFIVQKEFSVATADDEKHIVATFGVGPCVAIGIYDPVSRKAGLAHCDGATSPAKSMGMALYQVCGGFDKSHAKVYLLSQDEKNMSRFYKQLKFLDVPDTALTIIKSSSLSSGSSVGIDAKSGTFFTYHFDPFVHKDEASERRLESIIWDIRKDTLGFIRK